MLGWITGKLTLISAQLYTGYWSYELFFIFSCVVQQCASPIHGRKLSCTRSSYLHFPVDFAKKECDLSSEFSEFLSSMYLMKMIYYLCVINPHINSSFFCSTVCVCLCNVSSLWVVDGVSMVGFCCRPFENGFKVQRHPAYIFQFWRIDICKKKCICVTAFHISVIAEHSLLF